MSEVHPSIDDDEAVLAELMAKDLDAVRRVHAQLMAAGETDDINSLGRTYQRVARSLRQTLALKAKLKREAAEPAVSRPTLADSIDLIGHRCDIRLEEIQDAVTRVIDAATHGAPDRREQLYDRFDREADDWELDELWLAEHLDEQVERTCETLGLPADLAATWRSLPKPTWPLDPVEATPDSAEPPLTPNVDTG